MTGKRVRVLACHVQWGEGLYSEVRHLPFCWQQAAKGNSYFPWCPWPSVGQSGGWFVHIKPDQLPDNYLGDQPSRKHYSQSHIQKDEVCPTWYSRCLCFRQWPTVHSSWVEEVQQAMEIWASHDFTEVPQKQWKSRKCCLSSQTTDEKSEELFQCLSCSPQLPQYANTSLSFQSSPTTDDLPNENPSANNKNSAGSWSNHGTVTSRDSCYPIGCQILHVLAILYSSLQWTDLGIKSIVCLCLQDPFVAAQSHNVTWCQRSVRILG